MNRVEQNGMPAFDPSEEFAVAQETVEYILDTYNYNNPATIQKIMDVIMAYGDKIDRAWSSEYSTRTLDDAQHTTNVMISAVMAGMQVSTSVFKIMVGEYEDKTYYLVRGAKDAADAQVQVSAWYNEHYSGGSSYFEYEGVSVEEIEIKEGVTRL